MSLDLISKYAAPAPRYTSYPTAPHFGEGISPESYRDWLAAVPAAEALSLYVHIPFCDTLCWFCGCTTKITRRYAPVAAYLETLGTEIRSVGEAIPAGARVTRIHWGGGSPTILEPASIATLDQLLRQSFGFDARPEFSVEIDPRGVTSAQLDTLAAAGLTRASIGVQDFNPRVQRAVNRVQSFKTTSRVIEGLRTRGVQSINIDIMYGLPHQSVGAIERTVDKVLDLQPDRIALFGYAHVPWMKRHQTMICADTLPTPTERYVQSARATQRLVDAGYVAIGIDHFARPGDRLAVAARDGTMRRNFQGYTVDDAGTLVGLGVSSIGRLQQGYAQNAPDMPTYRRLVEEYGLAAVKGITLSEDDRLRAHVIERLMCDFALQFDDLRAKFGNRADRIQNEAQQFAKADPDGLVRMGPGVFEITPRGRPFARTVCSWFDSYFGANAARHSLAV